MSSQTPAASNTATVGGFTFTSTDPIPEGSIEIKDRDGGTLKNSAPAETPAEETKAEGEPEKNPHAVELGRRGGEATAAKRAAEKEADEGAEAAQKLDAELKDTPPEERKSRAQERVAEKAREARELRQKLAAEQAERKKIEERLAALETKGKDDPAPETTEDAEPQEDQFEKYSDFVKAHSKWAARQAAAEAREQIRQEYEAKQREQEVFRQAKAAVDHISTQVDTYIKSREEAAKADPAFWDHISPEVSDLRPSFSLGDDEQVGPENVMADEIIAAGKNGAGMMLWLSEHPEQFQRIASLRTQREISREMAKVEDRVSSAGSVTAGTSPPKPKPASKAPAPVRPVTGAPATSDQGYREGMSFEEYYRKNNDAIRARILGQ